MSSTTWNPAGGSVIVGASLTFATAIVSLSAASAYEGGLYVQAVPGVPSRRYVQLEAGDALLHRFDTMHGVHVPSGERLPLIPL